MAFIYWKKIKTLLDFEVPIFPLTFIQLVLVGFVITFYDIKDFYVHVNGNTNG